MADVASRSSLFQAGESNARVDDPEFLDQALDYLDPFDWSNRLLIYLKSGPIKHKTSNMNFKISKFNVG